MSSQSHPDADAFVSAILRNPAEITTRLVFADWLEETGTPSNIAWAHFIRLMANADQIPPGTERRFELNRRAAALASQITATIALDAEQLVGHVEHLYQVLPQPNHVVALAGHTLVPEVVERIPESVARENLVMALAAEGRNLVVAMANPNDAETRLKLEFILNFDKLTPIGIRREVIEAVIDHTYGRWPLDPLGWLVENIDIEGVNRTSLVLFGPVYQYGPVGNLLYEIRLEGIKLGVSRVWIGPASDLAEIRYRIGEVWMLRGSLPLRLLEPLADEVARQAGLYPKLAGEGVALGNLPDISDAIILNTQAEITTTAEGPIIDLQHSTQPWNEHGWW